MNITLSADKELIRKTRAYARSRGTSLNHLVRGFMEQVTGKTNSEEAALQFEKDAREHAGRSPQDFRFDRKEAHRRD